MRTGHSRLIKGLNTALYMRIGTKGGYKDRSYCIYIYTHIVHNVQGQDIVKDIVTSVNVDVHEWHKDIKNPHW
jgi:hypothetical protein